MVAVPFDFDMHLSAITIHRLKRQGSKKRYILFILDSSGSIGETNFNKMKEILSKLLPLFCKENKFAVMSYGAKIERNICFSCDQGKEHNLKFSRALKSIKYHKGAFTRSGDAIMCACNYMLTKGCGYENEADSITDVIFITDGHYNKGENPCFAARCFTEKVNVVSIAIGNSVDYDELGCIEGDNRPASHIFNVHNIKGLETLYNSTFDLLFKGGTNAPKCKTITN